MLGSLPLRLIPAPDVTLRAEILSYSRSRGLFAGVSLEGSTLRPDKNGNKDLYGKDVTPKDIVLNRLKEAFRTRDITDRIVPPCGLTPTSVAPPQGNTPEPDNTTSRLITGVINGARSRFDQSSPNSRSSAKGRRGSE